MQYRRSLPYRADRSARYGKRHLYFMRVLYVHRIYMWLLDSRKAWAANIAIEWLPCTSIYIEGQTGLYQIESENQKSSLIILILFHSACPYKNYCLKCFTELQTLSFFFFKGLTYILSRNKSGRLKVQLFI